MLLSLRVKLNTADAMEFYDETLIISAAAGEVRDVL
jgi:hypothetical protein